MKMERNFLILLFLVQLGIHTTLCCRSSVDTDRQPIMSHQVSSLLPTLKLLMVAKLKHFQYRVPNLLNQFIRNQIKVQQLTTLLQSRQVNMKKVRLKLNPMFGNFQLPKPKKVSCGAPSRSQDLLKEFWPSEVFNISKLQ